MITIQYLEDRPDLPQMPADEARARLRAAFERLPIQVVILGWNVPEALFQACAEEVERGGAKLYRWHPLLTGEANFIPRPEWQTVGLDGECVPGYRGLPEFTFLCPNRPAAAEAALEHLWQAIRKNRYAGVFLDRIRFPSPVVAPQRFLACFCEDCQRAAKEEGVDLLAIRPLIQGLLDSPMGALDALRLMLDPGLEIEAHPGRMALKAFLAFRARSVTSFVQRGAEVCRTEGLEVGLDCFSPALSGMVGQDLAALDPLCDWIKVMIYGHALGPATLPYEFGHLARWLMERFRWEEGQVMRDLAQAAGLPLPTSLAELSGQGFSPQSLAQEVNRARERGVRQLLAGMELVEMQGVSELHSHQITADLRAFREAGVDGFSLSWDLSWMPLERLELVRDTWGG